MKRAILLVLPALALSACQGDRFLPEARVADGTFNAYLSQYYLGLARAEAERYDHRDARYFHDRAAAALEGKTVQPESVEGRSLPVSERPTLIEARLRLTSALDKGARILSPRGAARAQSSFDCWMEEQEEGHQPADIAACREAFIDAIEEVEADLARSLVVLLPDLRGGVGRLTFVAEGGTAEITRPHEAVAAGPVRGDLRAALLDRDAVGTLFEAALGAEPPVPVRFLLYFEAGTDRLTEESVRKLDTVVAAMRRRPAPDLSVIGHTDTKGPAAVNERLARRRAEAVAGLLRAAGAPMEVVSIDSFGEVDPIRPTADDVDEPLNRRVEVIVR